MKTKIVYSESTKTFRLMPFNYWLASVKNSKLKFDSWDRQTKKHLKKNPFLKVRTFFIFLKLKFTNKIIKDQFAIFEGKDHFLDIYLYQVKGVNNDFLGEWHTRKEGAQTELKEFNN